MPPAAPGHAASNLLAQLPLPPNIALQQRRHAQQEPGQQQPHGQPQEQSGNRQPAQSPVPPSRRKDDCDDRQHDSCDCECPANRPNEPGYQRPRPGDPNQIIPPRPIGVPIVPGTDPNAPPEGDVWNNDGTPTMPPVTVEDQYDPPRWSPPPLYREPFDAYPPPSWGGIPSPGAPGSDGPSDNPAPAPSPAPAAPASPFAPQPDDQPVAPPAYGVVTFDSEGEPLQRDNRDPQRPDTLIPEHLQAIHQQVVRELLAAQAREDSLPSDGDITYAAGPRALRNAYQVSPVINQGWSTALNAAADPLGILGNLLALYGDLNRLGRLNAERAIENMRQQMRDQGVPNVPNDYVLSWVRGGNTVRNYRATVEQLEGIYTAFLQDRRLRRTWGDDYRNIRIGNQRLTPLQFERRISALQQRITNESYEQALELESQHQLERKPGISLNVAIGNYIDNAVRDALRNELRNMGINEHPHSQIAAVNRRLTSPETSQYGIPDMRLGRNLYMDTTIAFKNPLTPQLRVWHSIYEGHYMIIRPEALGGSYAVPPRNINKLPLAPKGTMP